MIVRDEVVEILLQIGTGASDGMDLVLSNHLREAQAELRRAHRARKRHHHQSALLRYETVIACRRRKQFTRVEVPEVAFKKFRY